MNNSIVSQKWFHAAAGVVPSVVLGANRASGFFSPYAKNPAWCRGIKTREVAAALLPSICVCVGRTPLLTLWCLYNQVVRVEMKFWGYNSYDDVLL